MSQEIETGALYQPKGVGWGYLFWRVVQIERLELTYIHYPLFFTQSQLYPFFCR